jgi:hypothetical protein
MTWIQTFNFLALLTAFLALVDFFALFWRGLQRQVPWFAIYLAVVAVNQFVNVYLLNYGEMGVLNVVAWCFTGTLVILGTMFTIEAVRNALVDFPIARRWVRNLLITVAILVFALALAALPYGSQTVPYQMKLTHVTMRTVRSVQLGVIVAAFAFTSYLALSWRNYQFGILAGYGSYVALHLACDAFFAQMGNPVGRTIVQLQAYYYLAVLVLWLIYILQHEPRRNPDLPSNSGENLDAWTEALSELEKK